MAHDSDDTVTTLTVKITMTAPVNRDALVEDFHDHVAMLVRQGYNSGEVIINDDDARPVRGWWTLTTASDPA